MNKTGPATQGSWQRNSIGRELSVAAAGCSHLQVQACLPPFRDPLFLVSHSLERSASCPTRGGFCPEPRVNNCESQGTAVPHRLLLNSLAGAVVGRVEAEGASGGVWWSRGSLMGLRRSGDCSHESSLRSHLHLTFIASGAAHDLLSPGLDLGVRG